MSHLSIFLLLLVLIVSTSASREASVSNVTLLGRTASLDVLADSLLVSVDLDSGTYEEQVRFYDLYPLSGCYDQPTNRYFEVSELHEEELFFLSVYDYQSSVLMNNVSIDTDGQIISSLVYHSGRDQLFGIIVEDKAEKSQKTWLIRIDYNNGQIDRLNEINSTIFMAYTTTIDVKNNILYSVINNSLMAFDLDNGELIRAPKLDGRILAATHSFLFLHYQSSTGDLFGFSSLNSTTRGFFTLNSKTGEIDQIRYELNDYDCNFHSYGFNDDSDVFVFGLGSSTVQPATCLDGAVTFFAISASTGDLISQSDVAFNDMTAPQTLVVFTS